MRQRNEMIAVEDQMLGRPAAAMNGAATADAEARRSNLLQILWRRQFAVWMTVLVFSVLALIYLALATPVFTSLSRLYIQQTGPQVLTPDSEGSVVPQADTYLSTQVEIIKSEPILQAAVDASGAKNMRMFADVDDIIDYLQRKLDVSAGKKDQIINVALDSAYPDESATVVNAIVDAYVAFMTKMQKTTSTEVLNILTREKEKQDALLDQQMAALVKFKQTNPDIFFTTGQDGLNIVTQGLANIGDQLTKAKLAAASYYVMYLQANNKAQSYELWQDALKQVDEFQHLYDEQREKAMSVNDAMANLEKLELDKDRTVKLCDLLDTRIKELQVTQDSGALNVNIIEPAKVETIPTKPKKPLILALALVLGGLIGSGLACLYDWMDQRIRSAEEVAEILGMPVLGVVPTMIDADAAARANSGRKVHLDSGSDIAEAYRTLRTAIFFGMPDKKVKTILLTSPQPGDGKSTSISNLAIAMAQAGQRTLLIDCDLRKPVQHKTFNASNDIGISNVVTRGVPVDSAIQQTEVEGLSILPCGSMPPNPAEILNSQPFADVLERLEQKFDIILIDSPPVLPVTDARILGAIADMTILVLRAEKSTRKGTQHAADCLLNVGAKLFGSVVNDVPRKRGGYGYYYGGYQYGGYGGYVSREKPIVSSINVPNGRNRNGASEKKSLTFNRVSE